MPAGMRRFAARHLCEWAKEQVDLLHRFRRGLVPAIGRIVAGLLPAPLAIRVRARF